VAVPSVNGVLGGKFCPFWGYGGGVLPRTPATVTWYKKMFEKT